MKNDNKEENERYVPIRDSRFLPCHTSPERARAVAEMEIDWGQVSNEGSILEFERVRDNCMTYGLDIFQYL